MSEEEVVTPPTTDGGEPNPPPANNGAANLPADTNNTGNEDPFAQRQGESPEQWASRLRGEVSWRDKQIGRQHRREQERAARLNELENENTLLKSGRNGSQQNPPPPNNSTDNNPPPVAARQTATPPVPPQNGDQMARARMEVRLEDLAAKLQTQAEWPQVHANFERAGGIDPRLMEMMLDTDDAAHVMLTLGKDMNRYQQILDLPEGKRRAALIKIGMETSGEAPKPPVKRPSAAPAPVGGLPAGGGNEHTPSDIDLYDPKYADPKHDDDWYRKRQAEKANSKGRPWSMGGKSAA